MSTEVKRRYGTTAQHAVFTGAAHEITIDTDKNVVVVHDGSTAGGHPHHLEGDSRAHYVLVTPSSDADVTLSAAQYSSSIIEVATGSWTAGHNIIVPNEERSWSIINSSAYTVTVKTAAGASVAILTLESRHIVCDGVDAIDPLTAFREQAEKIAGDVVQRVITSTSAVATGTTTIPDDDTIPQNTEGTEFITVTITPKSASNKLYIRAVLNCSLSTGPTGLGAAIFQDSTANALSGSSVTQVAANYQCQIVVNHSMTAGTTSATTFKLRAGGAAASTITINGYAGARRYGGVMYSFIEVTEVQA